MIAQENSNGALAADGFDRTASASTKRVVLKFGSSVLRSERDLTAVVQEIYRYLREGRRVIAVVSALGDTTQRLLERARAWQADSSEHIAALLATGEQTSAALLALALERSGVSVEAFDVDRAGWVSEGDCLDATPVDLNAQALKTALSRASVVVLPGFIGRCREGKQTLFGRGGSDLSALFVAARTDSDCVLVKDVDGVYEHNPNLADADSGERLPARRFSRLSWQGALDLSGEIVQSKAVEFARDERISFGVGCLGSADPTRVGDYNSVFAPTPSSEEVGGFESGTSPPRALRVGLIGLGTVGHGVCHAILKRPDLFELQCVVVRDVQRYLNEHSVGEAPSGEELQLPSAVIKGLQAHERELDRCDVILELAGGNHWRESIDGWLAAGIHVVTANKGLIADFGERLSLQAQQSGSQLLFGASTGGALPAWEVLRRLGEQGLVQGFEAVLNGTCNYVLEQLCGGSSFAKAVEQAQQLGFAEADPVRDLDGTDTIQKCSILARAAFPEQSNLAWLKRRGIEAFARDGELSRWLGKRAEDRELATNRSAPALRLVASCFLGDTGPVASVTPVLVSAGHPLAQIRGEGNGLVVHLKNGERLQLFGKGAGRWPTTEAVMGDLLELARGLGGTKPSLAASQEVQA